MCWYKMGITHILKSNGKHETPKNHIWEFSFFEMILRTRKDGSQHKIFLNQKKGPFEEVDEFIKWCVSPGTAKTVAYLFSMDVNKILGDSVTIFKKCNFRVLERQRMHWTHCNALSECILDMFNQI